MMKKATVAIVASLILIFTKPEHTDGFAISSPKCHHTPKSLILFGELSSEEHILVEDTNNNNNHPQRKRNNRFASPLLEFGYPPAVQEFQQGNSSQKPLLLYIPGFDGTYLSAFFQYPELHTLFEVKALITAMDDRSTFDEIKRTILDFLAAETSAESTPTNPSSANDTTTKTTELSDIVNFFNSVSKTVRPKLSKQPPGRPVYLVGESFGGIMALEVALDLAKAKNPKINLQGLTLVNAATCYDRSRLAAEGPPVAKSNPFLYVFGILQLLPMFLDDISAKQFIAIIQSKALPSLIDNEMREAYMGRLAFALPFLLKFMPQGTFDWRLSEWLEVGCKRLEQRLSKETLELRTLIIAGEKDLTLPSIAEAERLAQVLPNSYIHVVPQVGHANTAGTCLDLAAEMRRWFSELAQQGGRTEMKPIAAHGEGVFYGMEPRYDRASIGLNPLLYWSKEYYQKIDGFSPR